MTSKTTDAMDHPRIEDEAIVDRYLAGRLRSDDEAAFEEHLFACAECFAAVRAGEELRRGLRQVAVEDAVVRDVVVAAGLGVWRRSRWARRAGVAGLALAVALLALVAAWQWTELERLRENDGETRVAELGTAFDTPLGDFQVVSLGVVRDGGDTPEIVPDPSRDAVLLSLELQSVGAAGYRVELHRLGPGGSPRELLWSDDGLEPNLYDTLLVAVPASYLVPGRYRIAVEEDLAKEEGAAGASAGTIVFRVPPGGR